VLAAHSGVPGRPRTPDSKQAHRRQGKRSALRATPKSSAPFQDPGGSATALRELEAVAAASLIALPVLVRSGRKAQSPPRVVPTRGRLAGTATRRGARSSWPMQRRSRKDSRRSGVQLDIGADDGGPVRDHGIERHVEDFSGVRLQGPVEEARKDEAHGSGSIAQCRCRGIAKPHVIGCPLPAHFVKPCEISRDGGVLERWALD
jgi:hypothetical protein